jgi:hypothetical protein
MNKRNNDTPESNPAQPTETREQRLAKGIDLLIHLGQGRVAELRTRLRQLVSSTAQDAREVVAALETRGPDEVDVTWLTMHARELAETRDKLRAELDQLRALTQTVAFASQG